MKLSIIIPVYNERNTILEILKRIEEVNLEKEIIIVDDCSTDGTTNILRSLSGDRYKVIIKSKNEGKGAAIKTALPKATGDFVIFQDADLEYNPSDYPALIAPLMRGEADLVIGSRVLSGSMRLFGQKRVHFLTYLGCVIIAFSINLLYRYNIKDYYGCYKVFRPELLDRINVRANGFEYDSEFLCKLLKQNIRVAEVPILYYPRKRSDDKKLFFWRDGVAVLYSIIKYRFYD